MAIFMGNSGSLGAVYAGRFIAGLGVGQTVVVAPVYLAEIVSFFVIQVIFKHELIKAKGPRFYPWSLYLCLHRLCLFGYCACVFRQLRLRAKSRRQHSQPMGMCDLPRTTYITNTDSKIARSHQSAYYLCRPHLPPLLPPARITQIPNQARPAREGHLQSLQNPRPTKR